MARHSTVAATLVAMSADEVAEWLPGSTARYVAERVAGGERPEDAERIVAVQRAETFPGGVPAPGHLLMKVLVGGDEVGIVWIGPAPGGAEDALAYLYEIRIDEEVQGRGFGRSAMLAAEALAAQRGATRLALNVFGFNRRARSLYDSLGYLVAATYMAKDL